MEILGYVCELLGPMPRATEEAELGLTLATKEMRLESLRAVELES